MEKKGMILVVDDMEINREILSALLEEEYDILEAADGAEAIRQINMHYNSLHLVLLDLMMPVVDGFQVLEYLSRHNTHLPVIIITANSELEYEKRGLSMGAVDFVSKPFDPDIVKCRVNTHINLKKYQNHLELLVEQKVAQMAEMWASVMQSMADIIESRNLESGLHVKRTSLFTREIINAMNKRGNLNYYFSPKLTRTAYEAACLHDVGKIGIPDAILTKPGKLDEDEYERMKTHTTLGKEMIEKITLGSDDQFKKICNDICVCHHERWDGKGYPAGLKGEDIPLAARIVSVADTYDAITNDRPYRRGQPHEIAVNIIKDMSGTQFDPYIVDIFLEIEQLIKKTLEQNRDS